MNAHNWKRIIITGAVASSIAAATGSISQVSAAPATVSAYATSQVTVSVSGADYAISGGNFTDGEPVFLWLTTSDGAVVKLWADDDALVVDSVAQAKAADQQLEIYDVVGEYISANESGEISALLSREGLTPGTYTLTAQGNDSGAVMNTTFTVAGGADSTVSESNLVVTPTSTGATISGGDFSAGEAVFFWLSAADGSVITLRADDDALITLAKAEAKAEDQDLPLDDVTGAYVSADDLGQVSVALSDSGIAKGTYTLVAQGHDSGSTVIASVTIE